MYFGTPVFCHEVTDLEASKRFYEAKGMEVDDEVPLANRQLECEDAYLRRPYPCQVVGQDRRPK